MMNVQDTAKDVGVSTEELIEILQDIDIAVEGPESELTAPQITLICDELGYATIEEARADNAAPAESEAAPEAAPVAEDEPAEEGVVVEDAPAVEVVPEAPAEPEGDPNLIELKKPKVVVKDFAEMLGIKPNMVIAELMRMNVFASINAEIDLKIAKQIGEKHGFTVRKEEKKKAPPPQQKAAKKIAKKRTDTPDLPDQLMQRPPVVTFMGHVDHGKTSLLDKIRKTRVTAREAGGITQHIGAYSVEVNDHKITFLDTPGHAAFSAMRARGANMTDVVVLVVAADDGVMPQTIEAIKHAQSAGVCMIIAINKMDLRSANPDRLKQQLNENNVMVEDWGGAIGCVPVSAETGEGIDSLLERILLESEMLELQANPNKSANGFVVEAQMEAGMGPTASILVKGGTLKVGDSVICGKSWGRVKALISDQGKKIRTAGPSTAVKILGLTSVPGAGDEFQVLSSDREAKAISEEMQAEDRAATLQGVAPKKMSLDDLISMAAGGPEKKELKVIIKADVQGSVEAIQNSLLEIKSDKVGINIISIAVGNITTNDVMLASASEALILGFHTGNESGSKVTAKRENVEIRQYNIIYELIEDMAGTMKDLLDPELREQVIGEAEIREVFEMSKKSKIAGCMVMSGRVTSKANIRIKRGRDVLFEGLIGSLKRFQNEAAEVRQGQECGIRPEGFTKFEAGDTLEAYLVEKIIQEL